METFVSKRIRVTLHGADLLRIRDEKRHHFRMSINLSEDGMLAGFAEWVQNNYSHMQKSINSADKTKLAKKLESMSLGFWATEKIRSKFFSQVNEATLTGFRMERHGDGDEAQVFLYFSAYFPSREEIHAWTWDHKTMDFFMDFEQQQGELSLDGEDDADGPGDDEFDEDDDELEDDEEDIDEDVDLDVE